MIARVLGLLLLWLTLFRDITPGLVLGGIAVGLLASAVAPGPAGATWRWWQVPRLALEELLGIVHATGLVLRVLARPGPPSPAVVEVRLPGGSRETAIVGALLTLTPGTYVVDMAEDGAWLRLHLIDAELADVVSDDVRRIHARVRAVTGGPTGPTPEALRRTPVNTDPEVLR